MYVQLSQILALSNSILYSLEVGSICINTEIGVIWVIFPQYEQCGFIERVQNYELHQAAEIFRHLQRQRHHYEFQ